MDKISDVFTSKHKHCDELFSAVEVQVRNRDWSAANESFDEFSREMEQHFRIEEDALFPALERRARESSGPTRVMRSEHQDMRQLLKDLQNALSGQNADHFLGLFETLLIMMQQHNYKEENVLYRMADYVLADDQSDILSRARSGQ